MGDTYQFGAVDWILNDAMALRELEPVLGTFLYKAVKDVESEIYKITYDEPQRWALDGMIACWYAAVCKGDRELAEKCIKLIQEFKEVFVSEETLNSFIEKLRQRTEVLIKVVREVEEQ